MSKKSNTLDFGANIVPFGMGIRDFFPYWQESVWNEESATLDLKILRSLGARRVRLHILPINYEVDKYPLFEAGHYRRLIPHTLKTAKSLGLKTHLDLHSDDFSAVKSEDVLARLEEFGPDDIDTLQIINEYFYLWKHAENLRKLEAIFKDIRKAGYKGELCFDAGGYIHRHCHNKYPVLAAETKDMITLHHYATYSHWNDYDVGLLRDIVGKRKTLKKEQMSELQRQWYEQFEKERFTGLAQELRMMELAMVGFHPWAGVVHGPRAERWPEIMGYIARESAITTVAVWCFRDAMTWREYGNSSHNGLLYACLLARPELEIFRNTAMAMMPPQDIYSRLVINFDHPKDNKIKISLLNKTASPVAGDLLLETGKIMRLSLPALKEKSVTVDLREVMTGKGGVRHLFAEFKPAEIKNDMEGKCIGWKAIRMPTAPSLRDKTKFSIKGVAYPGGLSSIEAFLREFRKNLCIVVERPGGMETELAYRLQSIIAEAFGELPEMISLMTGPADYLRDKALIYLTTRSQCSMTRCIECLVERQYLPSERASAVISAHKSLFQKKPVRPVWDTSSPVRTIGDIVHNPGVMLVIGKSFETLRNGVYDLIQRISPPGSGALAYTGKNHYEAYAGLKLNKSRRFGVSLPAGKYNFRIALGTGFTAERFATHVRSLGLDLDRTIVTSGGIKWLRGSFNHGEKTLTIDFGPAGKNQPACVAALVITDTVTGAGVFQGYFHPRIRVAMDYQGYARIDGNTMFNKSIKEKRWYDIRTDENEADKQVLEYGWMD